ncbi:hypothetical protein COC69_12425 [Bacillus cereus]|uniref:Uncharacterized protein n=1 Tax=Bacillus cereus TaxID=1396 RepID=A0A9X7CNX8_BACCE|nr:hypothetical protein COC69_12425 [Bacillus cereus]
MIQLIKENTQLRCSLYSDGDSKLINIKNEMTSFVISSESSYYDAVYVLTRDLHETISDEGGFSKHFVLIFNKVKLDKQKK